jgi:hypothetical protein
LIQTNLFIAEQSGKYCRWYLPFRFFVSSAPKSRRQSNMLTYRCFAFDFWERRREDIMHFRRNNHISTCFFVQVACSCLVRTDLRVGALYLLCQFIEFHVVLSLLQRHVTDNVSCRRLRLLVDIHKYIKHYL